MSQTPRSMNWLRAYNSFNCSWSGLMRENGDHNSHLHSMVAHIARSLARHPPKCIEMLTNWQPAILYIHTIYMCPPTVDIPSDIQKVFAWLSTSASCFRAVILCTKTEWHIKTEQTHTNLHTHILNCLSHANKKSKTHVVFTSLIITIDRNVDECW